MAEPAHLSLVTWITAVELPVLAGLFWLFWRNRRDVDAAMDALGRRLDRELEAQRHALAGYKLEVAKGYASVEALAAVEQRLTSHLLRIEAKLDGRTAP